jgi:DNA-binding winged helix-turn-helix (wHTH) protein
VEAWRAAADRSIDPRRARVLTVSYPFPEISGGARISAVPDGEKVKVRFADCTLDIDARQLVRAGDDAHLPPKAFELLKLLIENRPRVLAKTELIERVWPGVFVSDASLAKVVSRIRKAIGQKDDSGIIRTVHGCGYAFVAPLDDQPAEPAAAARPAACCLVCGHREFPLVNGDHIVGRDARASIRLDSPKVSRQHARLVVRGVSATVLDLGSKNGSFVRGIRVTGPRVLHPGDDLRIGPFALVFQVAAYSGSTESELR